MFEFEHVFGGGEFQFGLGAYWHFRSYGMLEVGIETLFRIQFRAVAGQIEQLDLVLALSGPCLVIDRRKGATVGARLKVPSDAR